MGGGGVYRRCVTVGTKTWGYRLNSKTSFPVFSISPSTPPPLAVRGEAKVHWPCGALCLTYRGHCNLNKRIGNIEILCKVETLNEKLETRPCGKLRY